MLTDPEIADLRAWWRYALALRAHVDARPHDIEARMMLHTFVPWLLARPEWLALSRASGVPQ